VKFTSDEIDFFPFLEFDDSFLPAGSAAKIGSALPLLLALVIARVHRKHLLAEETFDRLLDLQLRCPRIDLEHILIVQLPEKHRFLAQLDRFDHLVNVFHENKMVLPLLGGPLRELLKPLLGENDFVKI
jgi:hypothetical protein